MRALLIAAPLFTKTGEKLWLDPSAERRKKKRRTMEGTVDFGKYMKLWRFKQLKLILPKTMEDRVRKETDGWWQTRKFMDSYGEKTKKTMYASSLCVLDESMSAFIPRTTKTGNLPNLSFVQRKPEPLGTEFKIGMDGLIEKCLWMETQEGMYYYCSFLHFILNAYTVLYFVF